MRHVHADARAAPADYGTRVRYKASWTNPLNDYDVYVHQGSVNGPVLSPPNGGAPATAEEGTFDINAVVTAGVNDTYTIHVVYWAVAALDPYHGVASLEAIPVTTAQRSTDRGEMLTNNPAGNTTVQVDDRQWMEFTTSTVLMGLRGSATADRFVVAGTAAAGFSDSTRAGGTFTVGGCAP